MVLVISMGVLFLGARTPRHAVTTQRPRMTMALALRLRNAEGEEVLGCTYENAENYVADATLTMALASSIVSTLVASTTTATSMEKWAPSI